MRYTDKQLLDFLQMMNDEAVHTGKCLFRISAIGRGWRLYETSREGAQSNVREAISTALKKRS